MSDWNLATAFELAAKVRGEAPSVVYGGSVVSWREFDRRSAGLAKTLVEAGLGRQAKVAQYLHNRNEYLESVFGAMKVSMVPVNTNYRYGADELAHLWDNADAEAVVFEGCFTETVEKVRHRTGKVRLFVFVEDGSGQERPEWAVSYEEAAGSLGADESQPESWAADRSGDDLYILYTGGTTGQPKGVMWRQDDLFAVLNAGSPVHIPEDEGWTGVRRSIEELAELQPRVLPACPLMHGTGAFTAFSCLMLGGYVVTLPGSSFDPVALLDAVEREKVNVVTIVGDAFARPILQALEAHPHRWDLSSLVGMVSSGVMWSEGTKKGLLSHNPQMMLIDSFASSEAVGMGGSVSTVGAEAGTAAFRLGENSKVIDDEGRELPPGSGRRGRIAVSGRIPLGYYKDEEKTRQTFVEIGSVRYSVPGDYVIVAEDGSMRLLGRGSVSINTGGEKVFPEEVEEALKTHPAVSDAAVVGVPDERFGQRIVAVVAPLAGEQVSGEELAAHVKERLASFKAPRQVLVVDSLGRSPSGKLDYRGLEALAMSRLGIAPAKSP